MLYKTRWGVNRCFDEIVRAALAGERCPTTHGPSRKFSWSTMRHLVMDGWIKIEISGRNYRTVTILKGEYAGLTTAPNPNTSQRTWKVVDVHGCRADTLRNPYKLDMPLAQPQMEVA